MNTLTQPLREEHDRYRVALKDIQETADAVEDLSLPELRTRLDRVDAFLTARFLPRARAEEAAVFPLIRRVIGARESTSGMAREDLEVERLAGKLAVLRERLVYSYFGRNERRLLRRTLYELYSTIRLHLAEEDDVFLPILDQHLSAAEAIEMVEGLEEAERQGAAVP
ncbi:MAG TPA: hemerythrin domain-containing protein [Candidatus Limnocylindrales bacterium]|nr:hemerythrin domain-containing protein [Candidatus Limnocylindrales bacterium]